MAGRTKTKDNAIPADQGAHIIDMTDPGERPTDQSLTTWREWLSVWAVGFAVFTVTTTEMAPVGLIPEIARDLKVTEGTAGLAVTAFGLVAGLLAPFTTAWSGRVGRRSLLVLILAMFTVGNAVSAMSQDYAVFITSRVLVGTVHGLMWSIVATIAIRLVRPNDAVKATSIAFSGISLALVLGVPFGSLLGSLGGWRSAFGALAILSVIGLVVVWISVPKLPSAESLKASDFKAIARSKALLGPLLITCVAVVGNYAAYTYIAPFLIESRGTAPSSIGAYLLIYGISGVCGNFLSGYLLHRIGTVSTVLGLLGSAVTGALCLLLALDSPIAVIAMLVLWGLAYSGLPVALQTLVLRSAGASGQAATSIYVFVFNTSIAAGALVGGLAIDSFGPLSPIWAGIVFSVASVVVTFATARGKDADRIRKS